MITRKWQDAEVIRDKNGVTGRKIYDQPEGQIVHMSVEAGCTLPAHKTPVNVVFYVLEGELTIEIGAERQVCPAGTLVESPAQIPHALYNQTEQVASLLVMKLPRP